MKFRIITLLLPVFAFCFTGVDGQALPFSDKSVRIFEPELMNPAHTGGKDFISAGIINTIQSGVFSQAFSVMGRITRQTPSYSFGKKVREYTRFGVGLNAFNDYNGINRNLGGGLSLSYHITIDRERISFLSLGINLKGMKYSEASPVIDEKGILPDIDMGILYTGERLTLGFSALNLLESSDYLDNPESFIIPVTGLFSGYAGYSFNLIRKYNVVFEPSFFLDFHDFNSIEISKSLKPLLKLYIEEFGMGVFLNDSTVSSFFFQYNYPGLTAGALFNLVKNSTYFVNQPKIELYLGINLTRQKIKVRRPYHW